MGKMRLDMGTADRMLAGLVDAADAPPGFEAVVELLATARAPHAAVPTSTIAAGRAPAPRRPRRRSMLVATPFRSRLTIAAAAVALAAASGTAYAAGLPAAASSTAEGVLQSLGVTNGGGDGGSQPSSTHGATVSSVARTTTATGAAKGAEVAAVASDGRSHAGDKSTDANGGGDAKENASHGHGAEISALAHSTTGTAGAKGATISAAASDGKSHAGEHGHNGKSGGAQGAASAAGSHGGQGGNSGGHGSGSGKSHRPS